MGELELHSVTAAERLVPLEAERDEGTQCEAAAEARGV